MALPLDVKIELQKAIEKIGNVLMETNKALLGIHREDYSTVAGSLSYNDPIDGDGEVQFWNVVLSLGVVEPQVVPVKSVVGILTPDGNVEYSELVSTGLKICPPPVKKWQCCSTGFRCVNVGGNTPIFKCAPDPTC